MTTEQRKNDHLRLTSESIPNIKLDKRFNYEPMFGNLLPNSTTFLGFEFDFPLWISSMTGGSEKGKLINQNIARAVKELNLGMGLGSIRSYIEDESRFDDFNIRELVGDRPLFANLGIAQIEQYIAENDLKFIEKIKFLECDGLIVHINPLQEAVQPEGDVIKYNPLQTIEKLLKVYTGKIIVKEVGQGFGPKSLKALLELPISAIELAGYGGTNFTKLELLRAEGQTELDPLISIGHDNREMINTLNTLYNEETKYKDIIISGGLKNSLDGFYYQNQLKFNSLFGLAGAVIGKAENLDTLMSFLEGQRKLYQTARNYLEVNQEQW